MSKTFSINFVPYVNQRPELENQPVVINNIPYVNAPSWHIPQANLTMARNQSSPYLLFKNIDLVALNTWHNLNASSIYRTYIPSSFFYAFDGLNNPSTVIDDGGNDMFDAGNVINLSSTRGNTVISVVRSNVYGRISTSSNNNFGFMTTSRNVWPQVSMAYASNATLRWTLTGGIGSDNAGLLSNVSSTYTTNRGYTGRWWANQGWGQQFDPSIVYTWFTIESSSWNTLISSSNNGMWNVATTSDLMNQFVSVTGNNFVFGVFLLSVLRPTTTTGTSFFLSTNFITNFLSNYVENANINLI
jgi:hypothetical protein